MRTLIIDNYDSFTFNLFQMIAMINGEEPLVIRNDRPAWNSLDEYTYDNIVISPGPGTAERASDFGICKSVLLSARVPTLGICLGHQGLAHAYGGTIRRAPEPVHGRRSPIFHDKSELWAGIPQAFQAVRYHSLIVDESLPEALERTAWTTDGIVMGIRHQHLPLWGVQFHPESICTEYGAQLLTNFRDLTPRRGRRHQSKTASERDVSTVPVKPVRTGPTAPRLQLHSRKLALSPEPEPAFRALFEAEPLSFWLDSSRVEVGLSRYSFMGSGAGPHSSLITYDAQAREVTETRASRVLRFGESIYTYIERKLEENRCEPAELPFAFRGGFVGYLGYELKSEAGSPNRHQAPYPDAMFLFADRFVAFDHQEHCTYLVALALPGEADAVHAWFADTERQLRAGPRRRPSSIITPSDPIVLRLDRERDDYLADIERCQRYIRDGESYEICLTNRITTGPTPPLDTYLTLRRVNPAPYSAFLHFGAVVTVLSSSPERFLTISRDGAVESKPIKGTRARGNTAAEDAYLRQDLQNSAKDRSENLMIVDLLRNDLGIVCDIGSVHVPVLMNVESYQTVHQLVSTVRGQLRPGLSAIDGVRHAFPGGSMTGAPKLRTMTIIDELEHSPRGVYAGAIGYFSLDGTADLSIVIRTLVTTPSETTIGIGGAIVAMSDPEDEFEETLLKARALIRTLVETSRGPVDEAVCDAAVEQLRRTGVATL